MSNHQLTYIENVTREIPAKVTKEGDLRLDPDDAEIIGIHDGYAHCSACGPLHSDKSQRDHGLAEYWDMT